MYDESNTEHHCDDPSAESLSAYMDGDDLVLVIDGVESRLPGGAVSANLTSERQVEVFVRASFTVTMADLSNVAPGS